jgi:hypothetical protein
MLVINSFQIFWICIAIFLLDFSSCVLVLSEEQTSGSVFCDLVTVLSSTAPTNQVNFESNNLCCSIVERKNHNFIFPKSVVSCHVIVNISDYEPQEAVSQARTSRLCFEDQFCSYVNTLRVGCCVFGGFFVYAILRTT